MALSCIVCHNPLEDAFKNDKDVTNQPYKGTTFVTHGHYGSTVFDPIFNESAFLEINICDECLKKAAKEKLILEGQAVQSIKSTFKVWKPQS